MSFRIPRHGSICHQCENCSKNDVKIFILLLNAMSLHSVPREWFSSLVYFPLNPHFHIQLLSRDWMTMWRLTASKEKRFFEKNFWIFHLFCSKETKHHSLSKPRFDNSSQSQLEILLFTWCCHLEASKHSNLSCRCMIRFIFCCGY